MKKLLLIILLIIGLTIGLTSPFWAATLSLSGAILDTSDFNAGVDNYAAINEHTFTGNHDAVSDGTISKDNCLMLAADDVNTFHRCSILKAHAGLAAQADFKLTYSFYIPAGQNHADGLRVQFYNGSISTTLETHTSITGAWTTNTVYWSAAETTTMTLFFQQMDGVAGTFIGDNDGTGDLLYLHNIVIEENTPLSMGGTQTLSFE